MTLQLHLFPVLARRECRLLLLLLAVLFSVPVQPLVAQPGISEGGRYPGTTGERTPYDTSMQRQASERTMDMVVMLEAPIDPDKFILGPNDILTVTIPGARYQQFDCQVYPDGSVVVPSVGEVRVAGRTLSEAARAIRAAISRIYRTENATVSLKRIRQFKVTLIGDVRRPGSVVATPVTRISEVLDLGGGVNTTASKRRISIVRSGKVLPVDLMPFYAFGDLTSNPYVRGGDVVRVGVQDSQSVVAIFGGVQRGGEFDYIPGDSISELVRYAFGFTADAFLDSILVAEISSSGDTIHQEYVRALPDGTILGDRMLSVGDRIFVRKIPDYYRTSRVAITGEVRYPGSYPIISGETRLRDILDRAGGFTPDASIPDAILIRQRAITGGRDPKYDAVLQIDPEKRTEEEIEYVRNKQLERPGIMTVDFNLLLNGVERENLVLVADDSITVPPQKGYVKVSGKVKNPGNITFVPGATYDTYIAFAGGYGWRADIGSARVIKGKNADTYPASSSGEYVIESGDQIFVPEEKDGDFWAGFAQVVTIAAQLGTIVAVVLSIQSSTK